MSTETSHSAESSFIDEPVRRRPRKIRCTQEFNEMERKSINPSSSNGLHQSLKKSKTRKQTNKHFLPLIQLDMDVPTNKENIMLNGDSLTDGMKLRKSKRNRKNVVDAVLPQIETGETLTEKFKSSTSELSDPVTETDNNDPEVVFKSKKKTKKSRKKLAKAVESSAECILTNQEISGDNTEIEQDNVISKQEPNEMKIARQSILRKKSGHFRNSTVSIAKCEIPSGNILVENIDALEDFHKFKHQEISDEQSRKSVRFISPSKDSVTNRRSTFNIQDSTTDITILKSISLKEDSTRSENSFKNYRKSPHVKKLASKLHSNVGIENDKSSDKVSDEGNMEKSSPILPENEVVNKNSLIQIFSKLPDRESNDSNSLFVASNSSQKTSRTDKIDDGKHDDFEIYQMQNEPEELAYETSNKKRSTFELPSPIFGPEEIESKTTRNDSIKPKKLQQRISIINLITPTASPRKQKSEDSVVFIKSGAKKLTRESTFTRYEKMCDEMDDTKMDQSRTSRKKGNGADSSLHKKKRRTWNKSLGVSFLDNSGHLQNITAPWTRGKDVSTQENETPKGNKAMLVKKSGTPMPKVVKTPPSGTSTPLPADKKHLLRAALLKETRVKINESKNTTLVVPKVTKMPNFALIHQRAYNKMENLQEMSERKASRAKLLLSGQKPTLEIGSKRKSPNKNRKLLHYSPRVATTQTTPKLATTLVSTVKNITPSTSNPKVIPKFTELSKIRSCIPKLKSTKVVAEKKGLTRLGYKVGPEGIKSTTKEEQIKAFVNKSKATSSTVEQRRIDMKNVRTNRRFELLMKMRNQNKP